MRINNNHWLKTKPIAHRGLWGKDVIENSLSAYRNAVEKGYPIEIDVYLTTDGELVSFHDKTLKRMTGKDGFIFEKSLAELKELSLSNSNEKIPTFKEVLEVVKGKVPLLIEIKNQPNKKVVNALVSALKDYKGDFAVQSFYPFYLIKLKKLAPTFIRGVLGTESEAKDKGFLTRVMLKRLLLNFLIKPDFISYSYSGLPLKKRKTKNKTVLAWTITDNQTFEKIKTFCDNVIFENFIP